MSENSGRVLAPSTVGRGGAAEGLRLGNGEMRVRFVVELDRLGQASEGVASPGGFGARRLLGLKLSKRGRKLISGRPRAFGNLDSIGREN